MNPDVSLYPILPEPIQSISPTRRCIPAKKVIWYNYQDLGHDQQWLYDKDTSDMPEND